MTSLGNFYSSGAELEARLHKRREEILQQKAVAKNLKDQERSLVSIERAVNAISSTAWKGEEPPTPLSLQVARARISGTPISAAETASAMKGWSESVAADRGALIGRASATFIYHIQDPVAARRFSPYLWTAYGSGMVVLGAIFGVVALRRWRDDEAKRGIYVEDLMREVSASPPTASATAAMLPCTSCAWLQFRQVSLWNGRFLAWGRKGQVKTQRRNIQRHLVFMQHHQHNNHQSQQDPYYPHTHHSTAEDMSTTNTPSNDHYPSSQEQNHALNHPESNSRSHKSIDHPSYPTYHSSQSLPHYQTHSHNQQPSNDMVKPPPAAANPRSIPWSEVVNTAAVDSKPNSYQAQQSGSARATRSGAWEQQVQMDVEASKANKTRPGKFAPAVGPAGAPNGIFGCLFCCFCCQCYY
ncbi:hypothetical protein HDU67_000381 [Dinochytrium kinnereticum]|nr:hypothetical protein HDU67_000381 [Dinochytrium kinnereticum]